MNPTPPTRILIASSFLARARGLLGTRPKQIDDATLLVLAPCKSIHTLGMRYRLDVAFLDKRGVVLRSEREVKPGRMLFCRDSRLVLERPHARAPWFAEGDVTSFGSL